ncbi:MAG: hypothetical protein ACREQL_06325 [Candidatus Binatia bacterium]
MRIIRLLLLVALGLTLPAGAATPSADLQKCQKTLHGKVRSFVNVTHTALLGCAQKVEECKLAQEIDGASPTMCLAAASVSCGAATGKIATLRGTSAGKATGACGLIPIGDLNAFISGLGFFNVSGTCAATNASDLVTCVFDDAQCAAERTVFKLDPRAQNSLTAGGIAASFPCVAP